MKKIILLVAGLIWTVLFWNFFLRGYVLLPSAERFVSGFYDQYNNRDFDYIYEVLSGQKIRNHMSRPQFEAMMRETYNKLGPVKTRRKISWKAKFGQKEVYFLIAYKVKRAKTESTEKFTLVKKGKLWFVFDYVVRSASFLSR